MEKKRMEGVKSYLREGAFKNNERYSFSKENEFAICLGF